MKSITSIVLFIAFFVSLVDILSHKPDKKRKGIWKKINLDYIKIVLFGLLLIVQLFESKLKSRKDDIQEMKTDETHSTILTTNEKVTQAQKLLDSILVNLKDVIGATKKEIQLISGLNVEMENARSKISESLLEYEKLNSKYSEQLELERDKVLNSRPNVDVLLPKSTKDSLGFYFQYHLVNYGQRIADSVEFESVMVLFDKKNFMIYNVSELKTNHNVHNITDLPPDQAKSYVANGFICAKNEIENYGNCFLLVKFKYYDLMTDSTYAPPVKLFFCSSLRDVTSQYGNNVDSGIATRIKAYFEINKPELYRIFFKN